MANGLCEADREVKEEFIRSCWRYLNDNFHKFNETNKIKIALDICKKDVPQEVKGSINVTLMPEIKIAGKPLEFDIGEPAVRTTSDVADAREVTGSDNKA